MMATGRKKRKQSNIPRRKRFRRKQRLQSAKSWLSTYQGDNVVKAYRKRFGVDWPTAFRELEMLGIEIDPAYKEPVLRTVQGQIEARRRKRAERAAELESVLGEDQDEHFAFIAGYTSGGIPYGITWEEWEALEESESEDEDSGADA
jgi:hypothetical protein